MRRQRCLLMAANGWDAAPSKCSFNFTKIHIHSRSHSHLHLHLGPIPIPLSAPTAYNFHELSIVDNNWFDWCFDGCRCCCPSLWSFHCWLVPAARAPRSSQPLFLFREQLWGSSSSSFIGSQENGVLKRPNTFVFEI